MRDNERSLNCYYKSTPLYKMNRDRREVEEYVE